MSACVGEILISGIVESESRHNQDGSTLPNDIPQRLQQFTIGCKKQ